MAVKSKLRHFDDGDPWMLAEDIPQLDFFFSQLWLQSFVNNLEGSCGRNYSKILGVFAWPDMKFYYGRNDCREMAERLVKKMRDSPKFGDQINKNIVLFSDRLQRHAEKIPENLSKKSNEELCEIIEEHARLHTELYEWGWLSNATDMFYPEFSDLLKSYLRTKASSEEEVNTFFVTLTSPDSLSMEALQHKEFLEMAIELDNDSVHRKLFASQSMEKIAQEMHPAFIKMFYDYSKKHEAMGALWIGKPFPPEHYVEEMSFLFRSGKSPAEELEAMQSRLESKRMAKEALFGQLGVTPKYRHLFNIFAGFMLTKFHRRYAQLRALYAMRRVFAEIERRFNLSFAQSRLLLTQEYRQLLVDGTFDPAVLKEREKLCVLYAEKGASVVFLGAEAKKMAGEAEERHDLSASQLSGQCASLGKAKGAAKIILSPADSPKMRQGDILVAIATNPDIVPAMKKAAAIVTEQGGVTCHAAIVSRELGIPCVIGKKIATKWLNVGDLVEVDAAKGIVRKV